MTNIDEILAKLNPATAKAFVKASETSNDLLVTPSMGLTKAIGGYGYGRQSMLWGNKAGGKTMHCLQLAAIAQAKGEGVGWIDAEKNFDQKWAKRLGVDPNQMVVSQITSIAEMADASYDLIKAGIDVLIVDSISALLPQSYFEDGEMKDLSKTGQIGTYSKNMGSACNMLNSANKHTALILISQVRNQIGSYGASKAPMGGHAVEHLNSTSIKLWSNTSEKEAIKGKVSDGNIIFERPIGRKVTWSVDKNRGPGMNMSDEYNIYFGGEFVGIDLTGEVIDAAVEYGLVKKGSSWYTLDDDNKFQGKQAFTNYLRENPTVQDRLYGELVAYGNA